MSQKDTIQPAVNSADKPRKAGAAGRFALKSLGEKIFVALTLLVMVVPAASALTPLPWFADPSEITAEDPDATHKAFPLAQLKQAGDYFESHFPARGPMISATATLKSRLFHTAANNQVIIGSDGWLYYAATLDDYLGRRTMSERSVHNAAQNLKLLSDNLESRGVQLVVAIAPNKATLYPEHLPSRYLPGNPQASNLQRLQSQLKALSVNYVDLDSALRQEKVVTPTLPGAGQSAKPELYQKTDTHWDYRGAWAAADAIETALGTENVVRTPRWKPDPGFTGDIALMLTPTGAAPEPNWVSVDANNGPEYTGRLWTFAHSAASDVTADYFATNGVGADTLFVFRDSFGNSLVPMLSPSYAKTYYSKLVPYDMGTALSTGAKAIVIERAQRHLDFFATDPAVIPSLYGSLANYRVKRPENGDPGLAGDKHAQPGQKNVGDIGATPAPTVTPDGPYQVISGEIPESLRQPDVAVYLRAIPKNAAASHSLPTVYRGYDVTTKASDFGYRFFLTDTDFATYGRIEMVAVSAKFGGNAYIFASLPM